MIQVKIKNVEILFDIDLDEHDNPELIRQATVDAIDEINRHIFRDNYCFGTQILAEYNKMEIEVDGSMYE